VNRFPCREKKAFFKGFQNPRTPSYFSNSHLSVYRKFKEGYLKRGKKEIYQLVGSVFMRVKKQAVVGCPISSICDTFCCCIS